MHINIIKRLDLDCLDSAISKALPFDYIVMNSQTKLEIACNSHGQGINYSVGNNKSYFKYRQYKVLVDESMANGEVRFVKITGED